VCRRGSCYPSEVTFLMNIMEVYLMNIRCAMAEVTSFAKDCRTVFHVQVIWIVFLFY